MDTQEKLIDVSALEALVFEKEDIRIVVRAPIRTTVKDFTFERRAADSTSVEDWLNSRIRPLIGDYEVVVVPGNAFNVHPRSTLSLIRNSYKVD